MGRRFALLAVFFQSFDEAFAKILFPKAVHHDARREGIVRRDEPTGEAKAVEWLVGGKRVQGFWRARSDDFGGAHVGAAHVTPGLARLGQLDHDTGYGNRFVEILRRLFGRNVSVV
jgi:hypothetical protein